MFKEGHPHYGNKNGRPRGAQTLSTLLQKKLNDIGEVILEGELVGIGQSKRVALKGDKVKVKIKLANKEILINSILAMAGTGENLKAITEIWDRVEGKPAQQLDVDLSGQLQIDSTININVNNTIIDIARIIPINMIIIALVAAKRGLDPLKLMYELGKSYYSKFSGFSEQKLERGELPLDISTVQYNWEQIKRVHKYDDNYIGKELDGNMTKGDKDKLIKLLKTK